MCSDDPLRSPLTLLRAGPFAECTLMTAAAVAAEFFFNPMTGVFFIGEILSFLLVRNLTAGRSASSDSATAAQVRTDGPADYNKLMEIYDRELRACGRHVPAAEKSDIAPCAEKEPVRTDPEQKSDITPGAGKEPARTKSTRNLTVKEELSLYVKKE